MLIGAIIEQGGFLKVYKGKIMEDAGNEGEIIVKMTHRFGGSMKKMRLNRRNHKKPTITLVKQN
jgi:hypothetical protein